MSDDRPRGDRMTVGPDVMIGSRIHVKHGILPSDEVSSRYHLQLFQEAACGKCSNRPNRPNDLCDVCPAYTGEYLFNRTSYLRHTNEAYDSLPLADIAYVRDRLRELPDYDDLDIRRIKQPKPFTYPLRFTGKLFGEGDRDKNGNPRANQEKLVTEWLQHKVGIIRSPPRTGKSVIATYLACELGVRTVIMADRYKLLKQFYDTYMGNKSKGVSAMTNAPDIEKRVGKGRVVFMCTDTAQLRKFSESGPDAWPDTLLINYQKMLYKPGRVIQWLNANYSFLAVDECHGSGADRYASTLALADMPYRLGLSATPERKDELDKKTQFTIGPVVTSSDTISLAPIIETKVVQATPEVNYGNYTYAVQWARKSTERNHEIVAEVFADMAAGHEVIILPVNTRAQQKWLCEHINERAKHWKRTRDDWADIPYPLAIEYNATSKQDMVIDRVDDGRPCVLVAIQSMIKQGIDMQMPSMIYLLEPLSATRAVGAPMFEQLSYRVATPSPRKPMAPVVKIWIDQIGMFRGSLTGLWWQEIHPNSKVTAGKAPKYRLGYNTYAVLSSLRKGFGRKSAGRSKKRGAGGWT